MKPFATLLLGLWLGATLTVLGVVGYSFPGVKISLRNHEQLRERSAVDPDDSAAVRQSPLFVLVGELNRAYFKGWNKAQLALGGLTCFVLLLLRRRLAIVTAALAFAIVLVMTFYLAPQITDLGRQIDFVPRDPSAPDFARFDTLHKAYTGLALIKVVLLLGAFTILHRGRRSDGGD